MAALLRMARLEQGDGPARRSCDLVALCREEVERMALLAPDLRVSFHAAGDPRPMEVDPDAIREALADLLDNARRHAATRIEVTLAQERDGAEVAMFDDGPGLPEGAEERAFEPFVALDGLGGSGLGLAIARGIARAHGGDVRYQEGRFVVSLPSGETQTGMGQPVVHFEVIGRDGEKLKKYYSELFGWEIDSNNPMRYGTVSRDGNVNAEGVGIGGGIGGPGPGDYPGHVTFYVEVPNVEGALRKAESLGGKRVMGPDTVTEGVEIGLFLDPEGHVIGLIRSTS